jgi:WD40 repeat protein
MSSGSSLILKHHAELILTTNIASESLNFFRITEPKPIQMAHFKSGMDDVSAVLISFIQGEKYVVSGSVIGNVHIWDVASGIHLQTLSHSGWLLFYSISSCKYTKK